jgi:DNA repair protein SbcD/Mre11
MKLLHTSDWHLGRSLLGKKRYDEFGAFLDWLIAEIINNDIELLIVAGDIFDTTLPTNRAQQLYYDFLTRVAKLSVCHNIVIVGGNHDSPTFLEAPKELLKSFNFFVIGARSQNLEDDVIVIKDKKGVPAAIVCAVPYLRDRDIRNVEIGESFDDKAKKLMDGIFQHYHKIALIAENKKQELKKNGQFIPIVATGHLFTQGGVVAEDDGVRDLYVGNISHIPLSIFPDCFDYVALGHLHIPQKVAGCNKIRYSGSPIPMGFGEVGQNKIVLEVEITASGLKTREINVPVFQKLGRISGDLAQIEEEISKFIAIDENIWLEIEYNGLDIIPNLNGFVHGLIQNSKVEILKIKNNRIFNEIFKKTDEVQSLSQLNEYDVFNIFLDENQTNESDRNNLLMAYDAIVKSICEIDTNKE